MRFAYFAGSVGYRHSHDYGSSGKWGFASRDSRPIWLDCSRSKQQALNGGFEDLRAGRRAEVDYADAGRAGRVLWIKVEVAD